MNWKLILGLGLTGALPPLVALWLLLSPTLIALMWTVLAAAVWVPVVSRARPEKMFATMVLVGVVSGVAAGLVDVAWSRDVMLFIMALIIGTMWGALFGGVALGMRRMRRERPENA